MMFLFNWVMFKFQPLKKTVVFACLLSHSSLVLIKTCIKLKIQTSTLGEAMGPSKQNNDSDHYLSRACPENPKTLKRIQQNLHLKCLVGIRFVSFWGPAYFQVLWLFVSGNVIDGTKIVGFAAIFPNNCWKNALNAPLIDGKKWLVSHIFPKSTDSCWQKKRDDAPLIDEKNKSPI